MLTSLGVEYVIVGHSERRSSLNETDAMVNKKVIASLAAGFKVILCVGEPIAVRKRGAVAAKRFIKAQLTKGLKGVAKDALRIADRLIIAYEPIWAIGTGRSAEPKDAADMAAFIHGTVRAVCHSSFVGVLYGGSVDSANIGDFIHYKQIDGALVGGASLRAGEFAGIIDTAAHKNT